MRKPEKLRVLNHIGAVARMAVKVNGNAYIVQQRCRFKQAAAVFAKPVQRFPGIKHGQRQIGDMVAVREVRRVKV